MSGIREGDIVELVAGPFKGEKARVRKIDEATREVTLDLFRGLLPVPLTVRSDQVRAVEGKDSRLFWTGPKTKEEK